MPIKNLFKPEISIAFPVGAYPLQRKLELAPFSKPDFHIEVSLFLDFDRSHRHRFFQEPQENRSTASVFLHFQPLFMDAPAQASVILPKSKIYFSNLIEFIHFKV